MHLTWLPQPSCPIILSSRETFDPRFKDFHDPALLLTDGHSSSCTTLLTSLKRIGHDDMKTALHGRLRIKSLRFLRSAKQIYVLLLAWIFSF